MMERTPLDICAAALLQQTKTLAAENSYLAAERTYYREVAQARSWTGKRVPMTNSWRKQLAELGCAVGWRRLAQICTVAKAKTIREWWRLARSGKLDRPARRMGRPRIGWAIEQAILDMARLTRWGTTRIAGMIGVLFGRLVDERTVARVLRRNDIDPTHRRHQRRLRWKPLIDAKGNALCATDFFTTKVWSWRGLREVWVLVVIHVQSRKVHIAGVSPGQPDKYWMRERAIELTHPETGFLVEHGTTTLIHDRGGSFQNDVFRDALAERSVEAMSLPANSPNLNAFMERWVQSVKYECLNQVHIIGESGLRHVLGTYLHHYHHERPHQGLENVLIAPEKVVDARDGPIVHDERLGGVLHWFHREAA